MQNKTKNILLGVSATMLFLALINGLPYGYFTLMRFIVFLSSVYVAYEAYQTKQINWALILVLVAILFNPFIPIHLDRELWVYIDAVVGVIMLSSIYLLKLKNNI